MDIEHMPCNEYYILQMLDGIEGKMTEFDNELFIMLVDRITVYSKDDVRVRFINGTEMIA